MIPHREGIVIRHGSRPINRTSSPLLPCVVCDRLQRREHRANGQTERERQDQNSSRPRLIDDCILELTNYYNCWSFRSYRATSWTAEEFYCIEFDVRTKSRSYGSTSCYICSLISINRWYMQWIGGPSVFESHGGRPVCPLQIWPCRLQEIFIIAAQAKNW